MKTGTTVEVGRADCEFCHGAGYVLSPVDGWHSTDKQLREPCVCTEAQADEHDLTGGGK